MKRELIGVIEKKLIAKGSLTSPNNEYFIALELELSESL